MEKFWILILVLFFSTNSLDKAESVKVKLEETPLKTFDEIFGEGWWDKNETEDLKTPAPTNFGQNAHHQIDRQNTQLGQIEPNSIDQNPHLTESDHFGQIEHNSTDQILALTESDHFGQIEHNSTDQNPPLTESDHFGQIEPNSTDQILALTESDHFGQIEHNSIDQILALTESDHFGQIEHNSIDQILALTESDHFDNAKNGDEQSQIMEEISSNENIAEDERKRKIIDKFHAIKDELKQKGIYSTNERAQIENKISKHLKVNRSKIYEWKKEFGLSQKPGPNYSDDEKLKIVKKLMQIKRDNFGNDKKSCKEIDKEIAERFGVNVRTINQLKKEFGLSRRNAKKERKHLVEKFDQMKAELKRDGFKSSYKNELDKTVAKELGITDRTISNWKRELGQTTSNKHSHSKQKEVMKRYYEIKHQNHKIRDADIAKMLKIGRRTLVNWKRQFKRQHFHPNSADEQSVEENATGLNAQKIGNSNLRNI